MPANSSAKRRQAKANDIRKPWAERERHEQERVLGLIKQKLGSDPPKNLKRSEADFLLRMLDTKNRGAPQMFVLAHRLMARHYWWIRETTSEKRDEAERLVAEEWGVTRGTVRKYGAAFKKKAMDWAKNAASDGSRPSWAVEETFEGTAKSFREFGTD